MFKKVLIGSALLAAALAESKVAVQDNESIVFPQTSLEDASVPLPYQNHAIKRFVSSDPFENNYHSNGYQAVAVPVHTSHVGVSLFSIVSVIVSNAFQNTFHIAKNFAIYAVKFLPAFVLGAILMIGICKLTPVCTKLSQYNTISEFQHDFTAYATPERLARATDMVQKAIKKFSPLDREENDL